MSFQKSKRMENNVYALLHNPNHTFVIAEAGSNWKASDKKSDLRRAKKMIEIAAKAGADAVKFQIFRAKHVYVSNAGQVNYLKKSGIKDSINDLFSHLEMDYDMIPKLANYCKKMKIMFMSTPFSVEDAKHIDPFVSIHKIASYEINHVKLLEFLSKTKKPIIISTGASTYEEIKFAKKILKQNKICFLQCTSKYPAPIESLNISTIPEIIKKFNVPGGLSDHSKDPIIAPLLAIGMGGTIIEKHFTLNKKLNGPDHKYALNPSELKEMIIAIRSADLAKGSRTKRIFEEEKELREFATRSIQAIKNISKGEILKLGKNIEILRSGNRKRGLDARFIKHVEGKTSFHDIQNGDGITNSDFK